jgi:hypothetical protein
MQDTDLADYSAVSWLGFHCQTRSGCAPSVIYARSTSDLRGEIPLQLSYRIIITPQYCFSHLESELILATQDYVVNTLLQSLRHIVIRIDEISGWLPFSIMNWIAPHYH